MTENLDQSWIQTSSSFNFYELQKNPTLFKAEVSALTTPVISDFAPKFYFALNDVQSYCAIDLKTTCSQLNTIQLTTSSATSSIRKLTENFLSQPQTLSRMMRDHHLRGDQKFEHDQKDHKYDNDKHEDQKHDKDRDHDHHDRGEDHEHGHDRDEDKHGKDEDEEEDEEHHKFKHHPHDSPNPLPPGGFSYLPLGFGEPIDQCLYQHFSTLSAPCQSSISSFQHVHHEYQSIMQSPGHHQFHSIFIPVIILGVLYCVFGRKFRQRMVEVRSFLEKINDPQQVALKAAVEAQLNTPVPAPLPHCCHHSHASSSPSSSSSPTRRLFLRFVFILLLIAGPLFVIYSSIFVAKFILFHLYHPTPDHDISSGGGGEVSYQHTPDPLVSALLLFVISLVEIIAFSCIMKRCANYFIPPLEQEGQNSTPTTPHSPHHTYTVYTGVDGAAIEEASPHTLSPSSPSFSHSHPPHHFSRLRSSRFVQKMTSFFGGLGGMVMGGRGMEGGWGGGGGGQQRGMGEGYVVVLSREEEEELEASRHGGVRMTSFSSHPTVMVSPLYVTPVNAIPTPVSGSSSSNMI